jgi:hypothetical protein
MFRKLFVTYLALAVITTSAVVPRRSEAAFAGLLLGGGPVAVVFGALFLAGGVYSTVRAFVHLTDETGDRHKHINLGMLYLFAGIILLDEKSGDMSFTEINDEAAKKWNLTWAEKEAYNNQVGHLNLIRETILASWNSGELKTVQDTAKAWDSYKDAISPEAWSAFKKVMNGIAQQI